MIVKLIAIVSLLGHYAVAQPSRFENLTSSEKPWVREFDIADLCEVVENLSLCKNQDKRTGAVESVFELPRGEETLAGKRSDRAWYLNLPIPPVAIADSKTLKDGACKRQLKRYIDELQNGTLWATQMFDASVKYPEGIIDGQTRHLGSFDQCYRLEARLPDRELVQGRYCTVDYQYELKLTTREYQGRLELDFDPNGPAWEAVREKNDLRRNKRYKLQLALCVPASCSAEDVQAALEGPFQDYAASNNLRVEVTVDKLNCQAYHEEPDFSTGYYITCGVLLSVIVLVVVSSLYDGTLSTEEEKLGASRSRQLLLCFSAKRNLNTIFEVNYNHRGFDTIHLLRFFSMCLVIVGHRMMQFYLNPIVNMRYLELTYNVPSFIMVHNGPIIVDGFFAFGGLLTGYGLLDYFEKTKRMNFIGLTMIRFLRTTPAYAFLIFFMAYIFPHMGSGPQWQSKIGAEAEHCAATWWSNLFYLNNYLTMDRLCVFQSWYLSVDFHCYLAATALVYVFWKYPRKIGYSILGAATLLSILVPFYQTYKYDTQPMFIGYPHLQKLGNDEYFVNDYVKTHLRMSAYLVGVIAGAILFDYRTATWRLSKKLSQSLFILLVVVMSIYSQHLGFQYLDPNKQPSALNKALYACLHRAAFAASFCCIILLITMGDGLDFHYNFLTPRWAQPLGRLTYSVFLTHNIIQSYQVATARSSRTFTVHSVFFDFVPDVFYSFLLALMMAICIEGPFRKLEKHLLTRRSSSKIPKSSDESDKQTGKLEAKKID